MTDEKLRKKLLKLCKWARRHGYEHVDLFAIKPSGARHDDEWYAHFTAFVDGGEDRTFADYFERGELDE